MFNLIQSFVGSRSEYDPSAFSLARTLTQPSNNYIPIRDGGAITFPTNEMMYQATPDQIGNGESLENYGQALAQVPPVPPVPTGLPTGLPTGPPVPPAYTYQWDGGSSYGGYSAEDQANMQLLQDNGPLVNPATGTSMGANIITADSTDLRRRRQLTDFNRPPINRDVATSVPEQIMITTPGNEKAMAYTHASKFSTFDPTAFQTPISNSDNKNFIGFLENPTLGTIEEVFEEAMPGPTTNKYVLNPDELSKPNRRLIMAQGYNARELAPQKTEPLAYKLSPDAGRSAWGETIEAQQKAHVLRQQIWNRDIYNNRKDNYASDNPLFAKEAPAGFVGLQPAFRPAPYLVPVTELSRGDWMPAKTNDETIQYQPNKAYDVRRRWRCTRHTWKSWVIHGKMAPPIRWWTKWPRCTFNIGNRHDWVSARANRRPSLPLMPVGAA
ncbi:unnamed protein product [Sphagnum jensenii]|uniref:Uncharacterized protein n=1 Tax=Sphagnum jensenii TaxID=128206 RepID=A0ABP1A4L3_9BRYO